MVLKSNKSNLICTKHQKGHLLPASLEIVLPSHSPLSMEDAFDRLEQLSARLSLPPKSRRRLVSIAMELARNMDRHRVPERLALLRIRPEAPGLIRVMTFNLAYGPVSEKLAAKFHSLKNSEDVRRLVQEKLVEKIGHPPGGPGDFGLEMCFLKANRPQVRIEKQKNDLRLVFVSFCLSVHET